MTIIVFNNGPNNRRSFHRPNNNNNSGRYAYPYLYVYAMKKERRGGKDKRTAKKKKTEANSARRRRRRGKEGRNRKMFSERSFRPPTNQPQAGGIASVGMALPRTSSERH